MRAISFFISGFLLFPIIGATQNAGRHLKSKFMQESCLGVGRALAGIGAIVGSKPTRSRSGPMRQPVPGNFSFVGVLPKIAVRWTCPEMGPPRADLGSENYGGTTSPASTGIVRITTAEFLPEETPFVGKEKAPASRGLKNQETRFT
jgi:hypothetical protein